MTEQLPSFIPLIEESIKKNWDLDAFTDYEGATLQYKDLARKIEKLHILFENSGVVKGDKIALFGRNCANWGAAFFAILTYGAIAVPILHEFKPENVHSLVNHSDAKLLFAGDQVFPLLDPDAMPHLEGIINIQDYQLFICRKEKLYNARENLNFMFGSKFPKYFRPEHVHYVPEDGPDALAMINYTSGSTGNPKGVMIPYRAIVSNIIFARKAIPNIRGERVISILPMAHMYGMAFEFVYEMTEGAHIFFLTRIPSPKIIFKAFQEIKPVIVISVPLIIEKVMRKAVFPKINNTVKLLMKAPYLGGRIKAQICQQIKDAFGNNFREVIIGGAAFNQEIEKFLHDVHFPYTVGYGTTETAPILAYEDWSRFKPYSCGKAALNMELKIDSKDPERIVGEILAKGPNVMLGYYKNPEATAQVMRDGWYHTGDLGTIDAEGNLTIKGRCKNMLLSASGQNVYPEEIEDKLNTLPYVAECLVVQRGEKFFGLVYPDQDLVKKENLTDEKLQEIMENNRKLLNTLVAIYEQLSGIEIQKEEFEKTPKKSIKRFLYS